MNLCDMLIARGYITPEALDRGKEIALGGQIRLPAALTRLGLLSEKELADAFAELLGIRSLTRTELAGSVTLPEGINVSYLRSRRVFPITRTGSCIELVMADPLDEASAAAMSFALGGPIERLVAEESDIEDALDRYASEQIRTQPTALAGSDGPSRSSTDVALLNDRESDAPVIRLVSRLITKAVSLHASDIHIEPQTDALTVRFRVDGELGEEETLTRRLADPVISRVKLMAKLDIAEKRLPQDGRIQTSVRGNSVDLRIATFPTLHGESLVIRILGQQDVELDIERIGLSDTSLSILRTGLQQPHGLILITGPTGSGKTTTLYAALNAIRTPKSKLVTVEDPIEYTLPGISQLQIKPEIGLTYAAALRSVLRNDPDIIMVGEIRDKETADIAIRAALTGHLVLATLHTNTAAGAITRLLDLGIEDYLIASVLLLTSAQRLVRRLCAQCSYWRPVSASESDLLRGRTTERSSGQSAQVKTAGTCPNCHGRGFSGRTPLFEAICISDHLRSLIQAGFDEQAFARTAVAEGARSLFDDGMDRALQGITTIDEILSVVGN